MQELCNRSNLKSNSKGEDNSLKMASSNGGGGSDMTNNAKSGRDGAGVALPISASQSSSSSRSSSPRYFFVKYQTRVYLNSSWKLV